MGSEIEARSVNKSYLFQMLIAQLDSKTPEDFKRLIAWTKAKMEPEDVKLVLQEFEELKNQLARYR